MDNISTFSIDSFEIGNFLAVSYTHLDVYKRQLLHRSILSITITSFFRFFTVLSLETKYFKSSLIELVLSDFVAISLKHSSNCYGAKK